MKVAERCLFISPYRFNGVRALSSLCPLLAEMSYLSGFPDHILYSLYTTWLQLGDAAKLDSAWCCRKERSEALMMLHSCVFDFPLPSGRRKPGCKDLTEKAMKFADECMRWVMDRSTGLRQVLVTESLQQMDRCEAYLARKGKHVVSVAFLPAQPDPARTSRCKQVLNVLCQSCPDVTELVCGANFTAAEYRQIAHTWPALTQISVTLHDLTGALFVLNTCRHLRDVQISGCDTCCLVTNELNDTFRMLGAALQHFRSNVEFLDPAFLGIVAESCPQLRTFVFDTEFVDGDEVLTRLAQGCPLLESIDLRYCADAIAQGILALARRGNLRELIPSQPVLQGHHKGHSEQMVEVIKLSPKLRKLAVSLHHNGEVTLRTIASQSRFLVSLELTGPSAGASELVEGELLSTLQALPQLERLHCSFHLPDAVLVTLGTHYPQLRELHYWHSHEVTDIGICALARGCPRLRLLDTCVDVPVTMAAVQELAARCLDLWGVMIGAALRGTGGVPGYMSF